MYNQVSMTISIIEILKNPNILNLEVTLEVLFISVSF